MKNFDSENNQYLYIQLKIHCLKSCVIEATIQIQIHTSTITQVMPCVIRLSALQVSITQQRGIELKRGEERERLKLENMPIFIRRLRQAEKSRQPSVRTEQLPVGPKSILSSRQLPSRAPRLLMCCSRGGRVVSRENFAI